MNEEQLKIIIPALIEQANIYITHKVFKLKKGWDTQNLDELTKTGKWLLDAIKLKQEADAVYARHPKEVWERYKRFGTTGLTEQVELNKKTQKLFEFLNKGKPTFIIKGKVKSGPIQTQNSSRGSDSKTDSGLSDTTQVVHDQTAR